MKKPENINPIYVDLNLKGKVTDSTVAKVGKGVLGAIIKACVNVLMLPYQAVVKPFVDVAKEIKNAPKPMAEDYMKDIMKNQLAANQILAQAFNKEKPLTEEDFDYAIKVYDQIGTSNENLMDKYKKLTLKKDDKKKSSPDVAGKGGLLSRLVSKFKRVPKESKKELTEATENVENNNEQQFEQETQNNLTSEAPNNEEARIVNADTPVDTALPVNTQDQNEVKDIPFINHNQVQQNQEENNRAQDEMVNNNMPTNDEEKKASEIMERAKNMLVQNQELTNSNAEKDELINDLKEQNARLQRELQESMDSKKQMSEKVKEHEKFMEDHKKEKEQMEDQLRKLQYSHKEQGDLINKLNAEVAELEAANKRYLARIYELGQYIPVNSLDGEPKVR